MSGPLTTVATPSEEMGRLGAELLATRLENPDQAILLLGPNQDQVTRASISAPLKRDGQVLGVISAQSYQGDSYDQDDLELLTALADLAAVALGNVQFVAELERRQREAERLEEIGRALAASLELSEVLERLSNDARPWSSRMSQTTRACRRQCAGPCRIHRRWQCRSLRTTALSARCR